MDNSRKLGIAIMGMGGRAGCWVYDFFDSSAQSACLADWAQLVAYCDLQPASATIPHRTDVLPRLRQVPYYDDYARMLARDDIDAVFIATPEFLHVENAVQAMEAGKHVLVKRRFRSMWPGHVASGRLRSARGGCVSSDRSSAMPDLYATIKELDGSWKNWAACCTLQGRITSGETSVR